MSDTTDKPAPPPSTSTAKKPGKKAVDKPSAPSGSGRLPPRRPKSIPPEADLPAFDERRFRYPELAPYANLLDPDELVDMVSDGRATVRANVALGFAAVGQASPHLVTLLRDSDSRVATAAAEAVSRLGIVIRPLIPKLTKAMDEAQPAVADWVISAFSELIGKADEELVAALDVDQDLAMRTVVEACSKAGRSGVAFLIKAARNERSRIRIRINAISGLQRLGKTDPQPAMDLLTHLEENDPVPDVRTAAKKAMLAIVAKDADEIVDALPKDIPDFEDRKLAVSELHEYEDAIDVDQMIYALRDGRKHVRINAARSLGVKGDDAGRAARDLGLLLRDSVAQVRREVARAMGKIGPGAADGAADLVDALGDSEEDVVEATAETLAELGESVRDDLIRGLETGKEGHGRQVAMLINELPDAAELLTEAFRSPAVNTQVNAARGLGMLGPDRVGPGLRALLGARTGGDARTRQAVRDALEMLDASTDGGPQSVAIDGFEDRFLDTPAFAGQESALDVDNLVLYLQDGRDVVRHNATAGLGSLGEAAAGAARPLGVLLRDDASRVRLAAAQALDALGDSAVRETADDLVGALGDSDETVAGACSAVIKTRKARMLAALIRGLETGDSTHARRILELINVFSDASEILCDAFESPAVNVQVNAATGLGMLGTKRLGKAGRKALDGARTGGDARTREAVRAAIEMLDGPGDSGPSAIEVVGFESQFLGPEAFTNATATLDIGDLTAYLQDGRSVIRGNAATALGALGSAAKSAARPLGVLLRDDDPQVRIRAANALDKLGDDAVRTTADALIGALRGDADVAKDCSRVLRARKARVLSALLRGLETDDDTHARRILEIINALSDAQEILCDAFESPAENVQVNAAIGIGMLGPKRAGKTGRKVLEGARTGGFARTRDAVFKALAMLDGAG